MPDVAGLLHTWEAGLGVGESERVLLLHALARPGYDTAGLLELTIGERDGDLFALRRQLFGDEVPLRARCSACGEEMEFPLAVSDLLAIGRDAAGGARVPELAEGGRRTHELTEGGWRVRFRLPTGADVVAASGVPAGQARQVLLARCVVEAVRDGVPADPGDLPAAVQSRVAAACAEADPSADVLLDMSCPGCGRPTRAVLDIAAALWAEVDCWARGTLLDVHLLASTYGWTEPEVLALSPLRRRYYLELAGHA